MRQQPASLACCQDQRFVPATFTGFDLSKLKTGSLHSRPAASGSAPLSIAAGQWAGTRFQGQIRRGIGCCCLRTGGPPITFILQRNCAWRPATLNLTDVMSWSRHGAFELDGNLGLKNVPTPTASGMDLRLADLPDADRGARLRRPGADRLQLLQRSRRPDHGPVLQRTAGTGPRAGAPPAGPGSRRPRGAGGAHASGFHGDVLRLPVRRRWCRCRCRRPSTWAGTKPMCGTCARWWLDCKAAAAFAPADFIALLREAVSGPAGEGHRHAGRFAGAAGPGRAARSRRASMSWPTCSTPRAARAFRAAR